MASNEILNAVETVKNTGFSLPENLQKEISNFETPKYRVAVVGKFQAGKSTLINHIFLQDNPILLEGCGLCTTSVTTEIGYGPNYRLEIYQWENAQKEKDKLAQAIDNPSQEELRAVTVGEDRVHLADTVSIAKYYAPVESLRKYTILDTPGIDDPDPTILQSTTYRIIPGCDLALVVTDAKQLDQIELDLLRKDLIHDGIARLMVLISYRPEEGKTAETRSKIIETIKAQLEDIGKENIPVEMYCFNESLQDILSSRGEISLAINSFLANNAQAGREAHVKAHLSAFLNKCLLELAAKIKASEQTPDERADFIRRTQEQKRIAQENCDRLMRELRSDFEGIKQNAKPFVQRKIASVFLAFKDKLNAAENFPEAQRILKNADAGLKLELSDAVNECIVKLEQDIRTILDAKVNDIRNIVIAWSEFLQDELDIGDGILTKIPNFVVEIANVIVLDYLLPAGWIFALITRIIQSKISLIKNIGFGTVLKAIMISQAMTAIDEAQERTIQDVCDHIDEAMGNALQVIRQAISGQFDEQAKTVVDSFDATQAEDKKAIEDKITAIKNALAALS